VRNKLYISWPGLINGTSGVVSLARLDLSTNIWSFPFTVQAFTVYGYALAIDSSCNYIYFGGNFSSITDLSGLSTTVNNIAILDLSTDKIKQLGNTTYNGTNGQVNSLTYDSLNNQLYVGGSFTTVKDISNTTGLTTNYIARWDISNNVWRQIGNTTYNGVTAINPVSGNVKSIMYNSRNNNLYIGGTFTSANNSSQTNSANRIVSWDISNNSWKQFGNTTYNGTNNTVNALALDSSNSQIYVGGSFTTVQDVSNTTALSAKYVTRWDISNNVWIQLGNTTYNGTNGAVNALTIDPSNSQLYVGGTFTTVQDLSNTVALTANRIARWDISNNVWRQLGNTSYNGTNNTVSTLSWNPLTSSLYLGGSFTLINLLLLTAANRIARYDVSNNVWRQFGNNSYNGTNNTVNALALDSSNSQLYVGGAFTTAQDISNTTALSTKYVARWDISNNVWRQFGNTTYNGTNNSVNALSLDSSNLQLYVGGAFTTTQDISNTTALSVNYTARWDISNNAWKQMGNTTYNGTNGTVNTLSWNPLSTNLCVGGTFTKANYYINTKSLNNYITKWDISNNYWNQAGNILYNGTNNTINAVELDSSNNQLYVGGSFTSVKDPKNTNGLSVNRIAKFGV
jgi:CTP:phosphocholine cytidylyltransferase-like protein